MTHIRAWDAGCHSHYPDPLQRPSFSFILDFELVGREDTHPTPDSLFFPLGVQSFRWMDVCAGEGPVAFAWEAWSLFLPWIFLSYKVALKCPLHFSEEKEILV